MKNRSYLRHASAALAVSLIVGTALTGCGSSSSSTSTASSAAESTAEPASSAVAEQETAEAAVVAINGDLQIGQAYAAAHGTKCYTEAIAVVQDDVVVAAYLDDFQFTDASSDVTGVPNSDSDFGKGYAEGKVLISKRQNAEYYSALMADHAGATVSIDGNYDAIQAYVVGKTITELEAVAATGTEAVDAVSGATLADTAGYLSAIVEAAKNAQQNEAFAWEGSSDELTLKVAYGAANGSACFTSGAALVSGDEIVLTYLDEFQFLDTSYGGVGVPNSDSDFAAGYADGQVLISKRMNAELYSKLMTDYAGATVTIDGNFDAIQSHVNGMSVTDADTLSQTENAADAVSGATLANTAKYVGVLVEAAKQ